MSDSGGCRNRAHKPHWQVVTRNANYSAFNGYHRTPSDYSAVVCLDPAHDRLVDGGIHWRTKAAYVDDLPDAPPDLDWRR